MERLSSTRAVTGGGLKAGVQHSSLEFPCLVCLCRAEVGREVRPQGLRRGHPQAVAGGSPAVREHMGPYGHIRRSWLLKER